MTEISNFNTPVKPVANDMLSALCSGNNYTIESILKSFKVENFTETIDVASGQKMDLATLTGINAGLWPTAGRVIHVQVAPDLLIAHPGIRYNIDLTTGEIEWLWTQPNVQLLFTITWICLA